MFVGKTNNTPEPELVLVLSEDRNLSLLNEIKSVKTKNKHEEGEHTFCLNVF